MPLAKGACKPLPKVVGVPGRVPFPILLECARLIVSAVVGEIGGGGCVGTNFS